MYQQEEEIILQTVTAEYVSGVLNLTISGDIDHHSAVTLRQRVDREIYFYRPKIVLLRLDRVDFMDSAGLGFFMGRYQLCSALGASFRLIDPPERVLRILTLSGMDKKLDIEKIYHSDKKEKKDHAETSAKKDHQPAQN